MAERITPEFLAAHVPDTTAPQRLRGLEGPVTVHRDAWGIPHVRARSEHDAFFAQGFVTAQDRLWQMDYDRRRAYGRWAEVIGPEGLESDRQMRRFAVGPSLPPIYEALAPATRAMLEAYAHGVNAFLTSGAPLPAELTLSGATPNPWLPLDSLAVFMVRHILMGVWEAKVWRARMLEDMGPEKMAAFHPGYQPGQPVILPPGGTFGGPVLDALEQLKAGVAHLTWLRHGVGDGSNNWVVGGARTASGKPLLGGDSHRTLDVPNVYYQNHVGCEAFDVIGFSFPGVPGFPHFAHNARVGWAITHASADYQDLYIERFDPADPSRYETPQGWESAKVRHESIAVKDGPTETLDTWHTRHGPVVAGDPRRGYGLAFQYTAQQSPNGTLDAVHAMLTAAGADDLEAAMRPWVDPANNLVYCDVDGAFGYRTRGRIPVRNRANAWLPVPGWTDEHEWRGDVPFEEMPAVRNPEAGYACTANNRITDEHYPHYIGLDFSPGFRAQRLVERLSAGREMTVADMAGILADVRSVPALAFRALYDRVVPRSEAGERALAVLRDWDGEVRAESPAPTVFAAWRNRMVLGLLQPQVSPALLRDLLAAVDRGANGLLIRTQARLHTMIGRDETAALPPGETWDALMARALEEAVERLGRELGGDPATWRWERVHTTAPQHLLAGQHPEAADLLNPPSIVMHGDGDTVQRGDYLASLDWRSRSVSVTRYIFDAADWERSRWVVPGGASAHPGSPHYADQMALYARHEMVPMTYDWGRVESEAATTQTLEPA